jgi:hypothetical protein
MKVLDYSVGRPGAAAIKSAGYVGVMRYVAPYPMDKSKVIVAAEYQELLSAGLIVGLNWEWYANRAREGTAAGLSDATEAKKQADALGYTGCIYFSVDYDAPALDQPALNDYFKACASVLGLQRLGAYAGYWPLKRLFDAGLISFGWQTVAWSGGLKESRAHLYQNTFKLFAGDADSSDVLKANWQGGSMVPAGWKDDGKTLTATNGQPVVLGFRDYVLAYPLGWHPLNVPIAPEYSWQGSSRQDFMYSSRGWNAAQGQFDIPIGAELAAALKLVSTPPAPAVPADVKAWIAAMPAELKG